MTQIELPVMESSTDLETAIGKLKRDGCGALIADLEGRYRLITAGAIATGRKRGLNDLSELYEVDAVTVSIQERRQERRAQVAAVGGEGWNSEVMESMLDLPDHVLRSVVNNSAFLNVTNVVLARQYASPPKGYYCDGPWHHSDFPPPDVSEGDPCPHRDGHKVVSL